MSTEHPEPKVLFQGELMICCMCDVQEKSDPNIELQWRAIQVGDDVFYACPKHFPPDDARASEFQKSYEKFFAFVNQKLKNR